MWEESKRLTLILKNNCVEPSIYRTMELIRLLQVYGSCIDSYVASKLPFLACRFYSMFHVISKWSMN